MRNEPPRHPLRFLLTALATSLALGVPLLALGSIASGSFELDLAFVLLAMVPAWSLILAAIGVSLPRKIRFSLALLVFAIAYDVFAFLTGWQALATGAAGIDSGSLALVGAYRLALIASPFVAALFFVGKRPDVLWTERQSSGRCPP